MGGEKLQSLSGRAWDLIERQHGVVARRQLLRLGFSEHAIEHRIQTGRLHPLWRGVYAAGRPTVSRHGRWMAAVLSCGPDALLSHLSAAALWRLLKPSARIDIVVPYGTVRRREGITVHRRLLSKPSHRRQVEGIPVTDVVTTIVDISTCAGDGLIVRAVNQADRRGLIDAESLPAAIEPLSPRPGVGRLRRLLARHGFAPVDTLLEARFLRVVRAAGLPSPEVQAEVGGFRVDFYWPQLGLVVETDGPRDHRTPAQQARDRLRDQTHASAGLSYLRFTEAQVRHEPRRVKETLAAVADRLAG
jgi:very-short-patch-repair endonuclease